jgi:excisionase family DNA binding protein
MSIKAAAFVSDDARAAAVSGGFVTVREAEEFLSLSRAKIYALMDAGELRYAKFGRSRRLPWADLRMFAAESLVGA